jgi:hypothetical protein
MTCGNPEIYFLEERNFVPPLPDREMDVFEL